MSAEPLLRVAGLTRHFGGLAAVTDFSCEIRAGEILGLIGPNGAGKSTTFNLLSGVLRPQAGEVWFDGRRIDGLVPSAIARLGLVRTFQHDSLFKSLSVVDNVLVAATMSGPDAERRRVALESLSLLGLCLKSAERAGDLSHGQQRLLAMAIAFAARPRLLCLDEPFTGLNQAETAGALDVVRQFRRKRGAAVLLVEHNVRAVMSLCDRVMVLDQGRLLAEGRPDEIARDRGVIKAYLGEGEMQ